MDFRFSLLFIIFNQKVEHQFSISWCKRLITVKVPRSRRTNASLNSTSAVTTAEKGRAAEDSPNADGHL